MPKYILLCEFCSWKTISDLTDTSLYELKSDTLSNKKYRCPKCGRAVAPRKCKDPQAEIDRAKRDEKIKLDNKKWMEESVEFQKGFLEETKDDENQSI